MSPSYRYSPLHLESAILDGYLQNNVALALSICTQANDDVPAYIVIKVLLVVKELIAHVKYQKHSPSLRARGFIRSRYFSTNMDSAALST